MRRGAPRMAASRAVRAWALGLATLSAPAGAVLPARAHDPRADSLPPGLRDVAVEQRLNAQLPLDVGFHDEAGRPVRLGQHFGRRPVVLALVYFQCRNLCPLVRDGLLRALRAVAFDAGQQFEVVAVSFDPRDLPALAGAKKAEIVRRYARRGAAAGWHFLTGEAAAIERLTRAAGFRYAYDAAAREYAHASGILILTPGGGISRLLSGVEYSPRDLRQGLVEASGNRVGSPLDQVMLFCYRSEPAAGKYTLIVMNAIRLAGLATVAAVGTFIAVMRRRERRDPAGAGTRA